MSLRSKVTVRVPRRLLNRLIPLAAAEGVPLNTWMLRCMEREVGDEPMAKDDFKSDREKVIIDQYLPPTIEFTTVERPVTTTKRFDTATVRLELHEIEPWLQRGVREKYGLRVTDKVTISLLDPDRSDDAIMVDIEREVP